MNFKFSYFFFENTTKTISKIEFFRKSTGPKCQFLLKPLSSSANLKIIYRNTQELSIRNQPLGPKSCSEFFYGELGYIFSCEILRYFMVQPV